MKLKRYNITKLHSVYGNDLRNLSSVFKYREIELQDYPTEEIGKEISIGRRVIPPYSGAFKSRGQAARARCCFGV